MFFMKLNMMEWTIPQKGIITYILQLKTYN